MKIPISLFAVTEQCFASAFTFFLFIVATRVLDSNALSIYSAYYTLSQSFSFFLAGLVLIPISTATGIDSARQIGASILLLIILVIFFAGLSPLTMRLFDSLSGNINPKTIAVGVAFFFAHCVYEATRWLTIRMNGSISALPVTAIRFFIFFSGLLGLNMMSFEGTEFALMHLTVNCLAALGYSIVLGRKVLQFRPRLTGNSRSLHLATFGNSSALFITNLSAAIFIEKAWGGPGLAAFQAMRSVTNPIGLVSQLIDNHYSATLARSGDSISFGTRRALISLGATAFLVAIAAITAPTATMLLLPADFENWWPLFPIMMFASLAHVITRPLFVNWRLSKSTSSLGLYSLLLVGFVTPVMAGLWITGEIYLMIALFASQPLLGYVAYYISFLIRK